MVKNNKPYSKKKNERYTVVLGRLLRQISFISNCRKVATSPNLLLLDEPTNDLDIETLRALEDAVLEFAGCVIVVSHDRFFMDRLCTHILSFEGESNMTFFEGNFNDYEDDKKRRLGEAAVIPQRVKYRKFST